MRIVILTSDHLRHKYFANRLIEKFNVVGVFSEKKVFDPKSEKLIQEKTQNDEEKKLWSWHFDLRDEAEKLYFGENHEFKTKESSLINVPQGEINNRIYVEKIKDLKPDVIVVFGAGLLKDEIIDVCPGRIINMHLGLSPYYRGSATNFWPLYNNEPEYVGVTIHFLDKGIDSGEIIHQGRPEIENGDNQHTIGCKTIMVGAQLMIQTINEIMEKRVKSFPQEKNKGKIYFRKDFQSVHIRTLKKMFEDGLIRDYLKRKNKVFNKVKLIP